MNDDFFVKIEDRKMPVDDLKDVSFDEENRNYSKGIVNFVLLASIFVTSFMWILLIFFRK